jgi:aerobic-type carbon monoxide dehydrogenase small subunit (CoxS/CutS family)
MGFFDFAQSKGDGLVFKEWTTKDTLEGPKGAGLGGNIDVLFKIGEEEKPTKAFAGQPLSEVAAQAGAVIPYKCKKGECGTCKVMIDGKWAQACQTKIPSLGSSEIFQVNIREANVKSKKASGFYSAQSFFDGFTNNAMGVVGFVSEGIKEEDNFQVRMQREKELLAKVAAKKAARGK